MEKSAEYEADDEIVWPALRVAAGSGAAGLLIGGVVGVIRSPNPALWATATGFQWSLLGGTYWGIRAAILQTRKLDEITPATKANASAGAGALTAAVVGAVTRGRANVIPGTIIGSLSGYLGQSAFNILDDQHTAAIVSTAEPKEPLWRKAVRSRFSPVTLLSDEEYRKILEGKLLRVDAEIAVLDDDIASLKKSANPTVGPTSDR